jgi:hypothetical protein
LYYLQVALKITKHCKESLPNPVSGSLLGLDVGNILEVTNCFPIPEKGDEDNATYNANVQKYQIEMMKCMREVNVDNNTVFLEIRSTIIEYLEKEKEKEKERKRERELRLCEHKFFSLLNNILYFQVGWYQSAYLGSQFTETMLEQQFNYQIRPEIRRAVVLIYDPLRTSHGALILKVFSQLLIRETTNTTFNNVLIRTDFSFCSFSFSLIFFSGLSIV